MIADRRVRKSVCVNTASRGHSYQQRVAIPDVSGIVSTYTAHHESFFICDHSRGPFRTGRASPCQSLPKSSQANRTRRATSLINTTKNGKQTKHILYKPPRKAPCLRSPQGQSQSPPRAYCPRFSRCWRRGSWKPRGWCCSSREQANAC